jgi:cell division protein FtsW (lipid II flippase)
MRGSASAFLSPARSASTSTRPTCGSASRSGCIPGRTITTTDGHPLIPFLKTDFIYSAIAQEIGLIGTAAFLLVYMLFLLRGFGVALRADDGFSKLIAAGLTFGFALQTFIIVGGILRIIPLTGITLPFVSYGGSSVVANFVMLAGLLLVSHRANASRG